MSAAEPWREPWLRAVLRCPVDGAELADGPGPDGAPALRCTAPGHAVAYPVAGGVPVLLADEAQPVPDLPATALTETALTETALTDDSPGGLA